MSNKKTKITLMQAAYSFYNVSTATPWVDLMGDALVTNKLMVLLGFAWCCDIYVPEMEKRADGADASVLFFLLGCANFLAVYVQIR